MSIVRCRRKTETRKSSLFSHPLNESQTRRFVKFSQNQNIFSVYNLKFSSFFRIEILIHHFIHSFSMRCVVLYVCLPPNANAHVADHSVLMTANPFLNIVLFWLCVVCVARLTLSNQFFLFFFSCVHSAFVIVFKTIVFDCYWSYFEHFHIQYLPKEWNNCEWSVCVWMFPQWSSSFFHANWAMDTFPFGQRRLSGRYLKSECQDISECAFKRGQCDDAITVIVKLVGHFMNAERRKKVRFILSNN